MFTNLSSTCIPDGTTNVSNAREFSAKISAAFFNIITNLPMRQALYRLALFFQNEWKIFICIVRFEWFDPPSPKKDSAGKV